MDTDFPSIVFRPVEIFITCSELNYFTLKYNVDILSLIQLGFTFLDKDGSLHIRDMDKYYISQFNF